MTESTAPRPFEPAFGPQALEVLEARYLLRDDAGRVRETPAELLWRVARAVAAAEARYGDDPLGWAERFYRLLARLEFLPNSPTLMNAGRPGGQLSACFVLPVEDDLEAIFETVKHAALIHQTGGGTGFSFSRLRPRGAPLRERGRAAGPVAFLRVFEAATAAVQQGGVRRGANMGVLRVDHPDIFDFIDAKREPGALSHFNLSVAATDAFMQARATGASFSLVDPRSGESVRRVDAQALWRALVDAAWATGDPGLVFIDRINAANPTPALGAIEGTNPCAEQPLLPYESCNLGSIDVSKHLCDGGLDWEKLRGTVRVAVRFLDDVIDVNSFPLRAIAERTRATRKVGLGVMGWADALIELGIPYASEEALSLADELGAFVLTEARAASRELAARRGPFPAWPESRWAREGLEGPLRNATLTTVAPTGTISLLAGCSSGIEPLFAIAYLRRALDGKVEFRSVHPAFEREARALGVWSEELSERILRQGHLSPTDPLQLRRRFQTAHEIPPEWHVRVQAAFQRHVESAVSKTVNLPAEATTDDVERAYLLAYELGCKGITVYRDGTRAGQVLRVEGAGPTCGTAGCSL